MDRKIWTPNHSSIKCTFKKPNFRGEYIYKLNKDVYTVEYIQEKESFQPKIVEEEYNKVSFEYFQNLLCKFPDHKLVELIGLKAKLDNKY